jgi:MFS family permease
MEKTSKNIDGRLDHRHRDHRSRLDHRHREHQTPPGKLWSRAFVALLAVNFLTFFGFHTMTPTLPLYAREMGAPDALLGWVLASTTITAIVFRPLVGAALDRLGRRWLFLSGILFMGLTTLPIAFFPAFAPLLALRTFMGLAWAIASTSSSTIAADIIPRKRLGEGIGFYGISASFAMTLAPALSLYLFHLQGIRPALLIGFGAFVASLLIALPLKYRSGKEVCGDGRAPNDAPPPPPALAPAAPRGVATFIERKALLPALMAFFLMGSFGAIQAFAAILAELRFIEGSPLFFFVFAGLMLLTRPLFGTLADRRGYRLPLLIGLSFACAGIVTLSFATNLPVLLVAATLVGVGFGATQPTIQTMAVADVSLARRGTATATYFVGFDGGIGVGAIAGGLLAQNLGYGTMFQLMALLPLTTLLIFLLATNRPPKKDHPHF